MSDPLAALKDAVASAGPGPIITASVPPRRGFWATVFFVFRAGWRPASGWVCGGVILVNGIVIPLARLHDPSIPGIDWRGLTPFAAILIGQAAIRTLEKIRGVSD